MRTLLILALTLSSAAAGFAQKTKNILDKQSFFVEVIVKSQIGKDDKITDIVEFKMGKVSSKFSKDNGFDDAKYSTTTQDGMISEIITFTAESTNSKGEKIIWEGTVNGSDIEGVATREKKGKTKALYEFKGTEK